ncbi:KICSTOR complex protein ITFG2 isoform X2 [Cimex lectularius]|uniref:Uncharacterized protein n=1 Tax=Cimex lectularius TaxID=79782 RepID=A0A8I6SFR8_CIMLE|nr:KICSTOR complex protein ITFG2 isoform X2 [Cimex lectularius]
MRSVCFVNKFEFDFVGKVLQDAICIGDIDNDGESELLVGNTNGDLSIFKGEKLWQKISGLGMIASVAVGDVTNCGSNAVVTVSVEGWCHIYLCLNYTKSGSGEKLQRLHKQCIPANTKILVYYDVAMESLVLHSLYALQLKDSRLSSLSRNELKQLTNFCLYNFKGSKK